jgi:hypothetical protein
MRRFTSMVQLTEGMSVLDLGGTASIWRNVPQPALDITLLNLEYGTSANETAPSHRFQQLVGDACNATAFGDGSFQLVFSNSVIEHVGDAGKRAAFAREVRRLGRSYWIQTPAIWFPIEPHCGMPFWWFYPKRLRAWFITSWRKKLPAFTEFIEGTDIVSKAEMRRLFPEAKILVERLLGVPKSYVAVYSPPTDKPGT